MNLPRCPAWLVLIEIIVTRKPFRDIFLRDPKHRQTWNRYFSATGPKLYSDFELQEVVMRDGRTPIDDKAEEDADDDPSWIPK